MTKPFRTQDDLIDQPMDVGLVGQAVVITGPEGMALAITADAAAASSQLLKIAARRARKAAPDAFVQKIRIAKPRKP